MTTINRRDCAKGLLGAAGMSLLPRKSSGQSVVPPEGIGNRFRHLSYSDIGGRPDSVQVMRNRGHLYVGHMFSNGVTILDANDPRRLKPVGFFTGGDYTRTHYPIRARTFESRVNEYYAPDVSAVAPPVVMEVRK